MNAWKFAKVQKKYTQVLYTGVQVTAQEDLVVLGASTGSAALESTVEEKTQVFQAFSQKLQRIDAHYAWFLIKNCLYMPRLLYVLRTSPCFKLCEKLSCRVQRARADIKYHQSPPTKLEGVGLWIVVSCNFFLKVVLLTTI